MKKEHSKSKMWLRQIGGIALLLLLLVLVRVFLLNTYYVGQVDDLPEGIREKSLLIVALQSEPKETDELAVIKLYNKEGNSRLVPARIIQSSHATNGREVLVDIGPSDIWILRKQIRGKVVGQIKLL